MGNSECQKFDGCPMDSCFIDQNKSNYSNCKSSQIDPEKSAFYWKRFLKIFLNSSHNLKT